MSIGPESRYNYSATMRMTNSAGYLVEHEYLDIRPSLVNIVHPDNVEFTPSPTQSWSNIAWQRLGDGRRYWIIADYSGVIDPLSELHPERTARALTQLESNVAAGNVTEIVVKHTKRIRRGMVLRIEDLNLANPSARFEAVVTAINPTTRVVTIQPLQGVPAVPAALSRVSELYTPTVVLTCPSVNRAFFEALNFGNPLNTLVE